MTATAADVFLRSGGIDAVFDGTRRSAFFADRILPIGCDFAFLTDDLDCYTQERLRALLFPVIDRVCDFPGPFHFLTIEPHSLHSQVHEVGDLGNGVVRRGIRDGRLDVAGVADCHGSGNTGAQSGENEALNPSHPGHFYDDVCIFD